ncbi:hypothetical protein QTP88_001144 [Uroleucon formosanum]
MYYFKLNENQLKKLREAHKNDTNATFQIASNKIFKGENIYYLDKIQLDKLKNAKEKKSGVRLEIRSSQIKDKKGGFLPLIFAGIGAASALVGGVTSIVNTVNDYKHKKAMEKETIRHNKEMENKDKMILAKELHKPVRKKFPKRRIFTKGIDDLWAADLVIMRNYSDENKGYSYIITVIDTFSKFSWALELKKKDGINVSEAFEKIIKQAISQNHQAPKLLHADKGNIFIISQGDVDFGNGKPYVSKLLHSPTWLELCKIANEQIIATGDYTHHFLEDIKFIQDLGNIKIHLKSIRHQNNDPDQTIKPKFNKTYKGRTTKPIRQKKEKIPKTNNKQIRTKKEIIPKPHRVFNFSAKMFEKNNMIRPILKTDETAFQSRLKTYVIKNNMAIKDVQVFLNRLDNPVIGQLKHALKKKNLKVNIMFLAIYKRGTNEENMEYKECNFKTTNKILTTNSDLNVYYTNEKIKIVNEIEEFVMKNSQWRLHQILSLGININKYVPFKGSSYIPLPKHIGDKKAIINVQNKDDKCFLWAILSALHPVEKNPQRVIKYIPFENEFDKEFKDIEFPLKTTDIPKFVKRTKDISINIYCLDKKVIVPLEISKIEKTNHIDLLYLREDNENKGHYCWIKDLWKLCGSQMTKDGHKRFLCKMCLNSFDEEYKLNDHKHYCVNNKAAKIVLPEAYNKTLEFQNYNHSLRVPFVIYADFECTLKPIYTCQPNDTESFTKCYQKHIPNNFCYYIKYSNGDYKPPVVYSGPNVAQQFYECMKNEEILISKMYDKIVPMKTLNVEQLNNYYNKSDKCHICERYLSDLPPMLEKKFKIIKGVIEYYKQFKIVEDHDAKKIKKIKGVIEYYKKFKMVKDGDAKKSKLYKKKFKIIKDVIKYYKKLKIVEDDDSKKLKLYEDKLKNEIENKNKNMRKVRDHDHLTGEYRGAAHSICNLNYQNPRFIPIVFHNLSGYDAHLFIKEFGNDNKRIKLIPNNEEKYISFSKMMPRKVTRKGKEIVIYTELRFIDSFKFLPSSLNKLTNNLRNDSKLNLRNKFKELSKYFPEEHLDLVTRKLAYPYEYMDCEEKFNETCLPPIEKFYSSLTNKNITKEEYENSQKIWKVFNIQNMREFTSLYNKIDVLLSTDIIENFRDISLKNYKLDPMWYYTTPGFAWDCMLRMTNIKLDLLTDIDQLLIFESGIRGGLSQCSQRYSKANNKYMGDKFKKKEESIFLQYLDANNLYGWAMSKYLPTGDFKWVDNVNNFDVMNISDKSCKGYILEVDLSYPKELHDIHSDFPLAPERHFDNKQLPKLLTTLYDKKKYIIHYETLKLYINLGLKIEKIHRVLEFSQSPWLKSYIDFNTKLRSEAKNEFEKEYFKLMNNSVYGRTMMNVRNHVDIRLCSNGSTVEKLITKPNFDRRTIFTENLAAVHMKRTQISFKQPIYIGMCVLDLSKMLMYDFYYNIIKKKYGNRVRLLYTDTDSLILEIKTNDFYQDIKINLDHFDTSDYPKDNIYGLPLVNKKVLGKFKDELDGKIMTEFIGLRSKLYSHRILDTEKEIKKAKGVKKNVVENKICFNDFENCLLTKESKYIKQNLFRTKKHDIFTVEQNKKALSVYDDKRFILDNGIDTLAWGHYKTNIDRNDFVNHLNTLIKNQNQKD